MYIEYKLIPFFYLLVWSAFLHGLSRLDVTHFRMLSGVLADKNIFLHDLSRYLFLKKKVVKTRALYRFPKLSLYSALFFSKFG